MCTNKCWWDLVAIVHTFYFDDPSSNSAQDYKIENTMLNIMNLLQKRPARWLIFEGVISKLTRPETKILLCLDPLKGEKEPESSLCYF